MKKIVLCFVVILSMSIPCQVMAAHIDGSPTGLANPGNIITFDELGYRQDQTITNQFTGASFNGLIWDNSNGGSGTGFDGGGLTNYTTNSGPAASLNGVISFAGDVSAAAFAITGMGSDYTFRALNNGQEVESFTSFIGMSPGSGYVGFTNIVFDTIEILTEGPILKSIFAIDNLQFNNASSAPVPEPSTLLLFGAGLAGVAFLRRRAKK